MLVWLDLETTGLDPVNDDILQLGMVVTDDDLTERGRMSWVMFNTGPTASTHPVVVDMHTQNGLWVACQDSRLQCIQVVREAIAWLETLGVERGKVQLAGNTIGFDRSFLRVWMPELLAHFHYRSVDMSSVNELSRRWWPALYEARPQASAHRALDDLDASIALAAHYRDLLLAPVEVRGS